MGHASLGHVFPQHVVQGQNAEGGFNTGGINFFQNIRIVQNLVELFRELGHFRFGNFQPGKRSDVFYIFFRYFHVFTILNIIKLPN